VVVNNQTSDEQTVSTVIRRPETDEKIVDETRSIPADDEEGYGILSLDRHLSQPSRQQTD